MGVLSYLQSSTSYIMFTTLQDFALSHLLVGLGTLKVEGFNVHCGSCQKDMELDTLKFHLEGDGHKLNTLWNYDKLVYFLTLGHLILNVGIF